MPLTQLHTWGATVVLVADLFAGLAIAALAVRGGSAWTDRLRLALTAVVAAQVVIGALAYLGGERPAESLHLVYGLAAVAVLPLASVFAAEAPPRARAWTLSAACAILLAILWRLAATG